MKRKTKNLWLTDLKPCDGSVVIASVELPGDGGDLTELASKAVQGYGQGGWTLGHISQIGYRVLFKNPARN